MDEEDRALFEPETFFSNVPYSQDQFMRNRGETDKMNSVAADLWDAMAILGKEFGRRFDSSAKTPDDYESKSIKEQIADASGRYGYCRGMQHAMMLLAQLKVPVSIPDESRMPEIPKERKQQEFASKGIIPSVSELEAEELANEARAEYEGDYVIAKGKKYYESDILALVSESSILNDDLTQQGQRQNTKVAEARRLFPGMTDDQVLGLNYKELSKEQRKARSFIRDYIAKKKSQAKTRALLLAAETEEEADA